MLIWLREHPWAWVAALVVLAIAGVASLVAHLRHWRRKLALSLDYESVIRITAADGGICQLRHLPCANPAQELPPVLMVHGIAANHRNLDLAPGASFARELQRAGRDVWLLTLRSGQRQWPSHCPGRTFSAMAEFDIPLAVQEVLKRTGADQLDYIGYSMGGMLMYAAAGRGVPTSALRRVAIIGSPGRVKLALPVPQALVRGVGPVLPTVPFTFGAALIAFASEWFDSPLHRLIINPKNMGSGRTRTALIEVICNIPSELVRQFAGFVSDGGIVRVQGEDVLEPLRDVAVPCLFVAGKGDQVAPPESVRPAYEAWGAHVQAPKRWQVIGTEQGFSEDYGHGDLALGEAMTREVAPLVRDFLAPTPELEAGEDGTRA